MSGNSNSINAMTKTTAPIIKPPFTLETARAKVQAAEDAWNSRDPERVALAYTPDSEWRNRTEFLIGREAIEAFLLRKWQRELDYRLIREIWGCRDNRINSCLFTHCCKNCGWSILGECCFQQH